MNTVNESYVYDRLRSEAVALLAATGLVSEDAVNLVTPKPNIPADLAFPVFPLAGKAGMPPNELALKIAGAIQPTADGLIGSAEAAGGFVNFAVDPARFTAATLAEVRARGDEFGNDPSVGGGDKVILEYSSPNIARKMHVGHLRTTVIGHSLHKIFAALGYEVVADNHLGDWGTQFGSLLAAMYLWKLTPWNDPDPVQSLVEVYARFNNAAKEDPALKDAARTWFKRLEEGDLWSREMWKRLIDITMAEFDRTYARLNVQFDTVHGESFYEPMLEPLIKEAIDKGVARVEEGGAVSVDFEDKMPSCLLRKTDGATLYQTRDAATCVYRWVNYKPTRNIYVVGAEQKLHFQQVFEIVRRLGYPEIADRSVHISFGQVTGATGERFSMRRGDVIFLEEVLDEATERATAKIREQIAAGRSEVTEEEIPIVAESVGVGAVIYADLHQGPDRNIKFDWDKMLAFEGNTGPYLQYTHARCRSILRSAGEIVADANTSVLTAPEETAVLRHLYKLPHVLREAGERFLPATVAEWTFGLAREFSRFYEECPVLKSGIAPEVRAARLVLVSAVAQGLKNGLAYLAIQAPEKM